MRVYKVHTISIFPLIISLFIVILISVLSVTYFENNRLPRTFILIIGILISVLMIRLFRGKFIAEIIDDEKLMIRWIKKPLFSREKNMVINIDTIEKLIHVIEGRQNDYYEIKLKNGESFSFHQPFFANHTDFIKLDTMIHSKIVS